MLKHILALPVHALKSELYFKISKFVYSDAFDILAADSDKFKLVLSERFLIKRGKPILNWTINSFLLELFDQDGSFISLIT